MDPGAANYFIFMIVSFLVHQWSVSFFRCALCCFADCLAIRLHCTVPQSCSEPASLLELVLYI